MVEQVSAVIGVILMMVILLMLGVLDRDIKQLFRQLEIKKKPALLHSKVKLIKAQESELNNVHKSRFSRVLVLERWLYFFFVLLFCVYIIGNLI